MNDRIDWQEIAASDAILSSAESLMERALGICEDGPFEDRYGACQFLKQFGMLSVEEKKWRGALWLKRLNELRLRQFGSEGIDEIAAFLHPRLHAVLADRLEENGRTPEEWQSDPLGITCEVFADQHHDESVIPGLLLATQIRLIALKNTCDDLLLAKTTVLEAGLYADAGFCRDAEESAQFSAEICRRGNLDHEGVGELANSLLVTSNKCDAHGEAGVARRLREVVRSICCDKKNVEYAQATVALANAYRKAGDLREAYRLAKDADRQEVLKDKAGRQFVELFVSLLRVELTGDLRLISTNVDILADEYGGSADAIRILRSHVLKMMNGEEFSDADLLEGAHQFVECARHSELMKSSEGAAASFVGALKQLLSMDDFAAHASFAKKLIIDATVHRNSVSDDLRTELESLERMVLARCEEPKAPDAMHVPQAAFSLDSIAAKLANRFSDDDPK
jgi:hypothetical protein